jgi:hypothetical protein
MERFYPKSTSVNVPEMNDLGKLPLDPSKRNRIIDFHPNQHEDIIRKYIFTIHIDAENMRFLPGVLHVNSLV